MSDECEGNEMCMVCKIKHAIISCDPDRDLESGWFHLEVRRTVDALGIVLADVMSEMPDDGAHRVLEAIFTASRHYRDARLARSDLERSRPAGHA